MADQVAQDTLPADRCGSPLLLRLPPAHLLLHRLQALQQPRWGQLQLEQVIQRAEAHRLPYERKFIISTQHDHRRFLRPACECAKHFKPIRLRHFHIGQQDIGLVLSAKLQRLPSILCLPDDLVSVLRPRKHGLQADAQHGVIICNYNSTIHGFSSTAGKINVTHIPGCCGASAKRQACPHCSRRRQITLYSPIPFSRPSTCDGVA